MLLGANDLFVPLGCVAWGRMCEEHSQWGVGGGRGLGREGHSALLWDMPHARE